MGIFNRKLLVLLIFINCFNNIYIFCGNGVEVEEIRDFLKKSNNYNKRTEKNDDESTQESDGKSTIDKDKDQIIDPTESLEIIKKEQDQDKEAGEITNWIEKNKILFSCLSIAILIGGFFGIKSLIQGLFGKKNEMEGDEMAGGDGEDNMLRDDQNLKQGAAAAEAELKRKREEEELKKETEEAEQRNLQAEIAKAELKKKQEQKKDEERIRMQEKTEEQRKREAAAEAELKRKREEELKRKQEKEAAEEEPTAEKTRREKELLKEKTIVFCDLNKEKLIDRIISYNEIIGKTNYKKLQKIKSELSQKYPEDLNLQVELPTIEYFNEVIKKNQNLTSIKNQLATIRTELANLLTKYNIEDLQVELPTIKYFNEVIQQNQNLINLINTPFNNINGEWRDCHDEQVPTESEGFLWKENGAIINQDPKLINNQGRYINKSYKMYINKQDKTIIAVEDNTNIIKQVVNFEQKFFIGLEDDNITIHFDNFKIRVCPLNNSIDTTFYLMQFMKKQQYSLGMYYTLITNTKNNQLGLMFFKNYEQKNQVQINIDEKFITQSQEIAKKFKEIYEKILYNQIPKKILYFQEENYINILDDDKIQINIENFENSSVINLFKLSQIYKEKNIATDMKILKLPILSTIEINSLLSLFKKIESHLSQNDFEHLILEKYIIEDDINENQEDLYFESDCFKNCSCRHQHTVIMKKIKDKSSFNINEKHSTYDILKIDDEKILYQLQLNEEKKYFLQLFKNKKIKIFIKDNKNYKIQPILSIKKNERNQTCVKYYVSKFIKIKLFLNTNDEVNQQTLFLQNNFIKIIDNIIFSDKSNLSNILKVDFEIKKNQNSLVFFDANFNEFLLQLQKIYFFYLKHKEQKMLNNNQVNEQKLLFNLEPIYEQSKNNHDKNQKIIMEKMEEIETIKQKIEQEKGETALILKNYR